MEPTTAEKLTDDQVRALDEIRNAQRPGSRHVLSGSAGTGKTTLMEHYARQAKAKGKTIVLTAPTHKAVAVLRSKIERAGIEDVACTTIHSLLQLKAVPHGDQMLFRRDRRAEPVTADIVVVDECSMVGTDLYGHIRRHLPNSFVLFSGDRAQIPPVGEVDSETFGIASRSHLDQIVRQAEGNPVLAAAHAVRMSQGGEADWSWVQQVDQRPNGVFLPGVNADHWLKKAFTSAEFEADPDAFRAVCWTNARVAQLNAKIRRWRYGDHIPTPFMPGERALARAPVMVGDDIVMQTNDEAKVISITRDTYVHEIVACAGCARWWAEVPSWRLELERDGGARVEVHMPADERAYERVLERLKDEAAEDRDRWGHFHDFKVSMAKLQTPYCLTAHTSQGSTFQNCFVDVGDIRKRFSSDLLEGQRILYTALTRPRKAAILLGV